ncbi:TPA: hypothetical protein CPT96_00620 [Candidatus Gastranaerophilales bacterium HUM_10]|nr:MAG TPA: hypothetical protein CPT96_00620 [Candidatus Gastranaerophilales bacterium HUM_10]
MEQEKLNQVGHLLLETKCLARLSALASDSCVIDEELQLKDNIDYYFVLRKIVNIINEVENILNN